MSSLATVEDRFCRGCAHPLRGLTVPMCPECGRAFDSEDARTTRAAPPKLRSVMLVWMSRLAAAGMAFVAAFVAWHHDARLLSETSLVWAIAFTLCSGALVAMFPMRPRLTALALLATIAGLLVTAGALMWHSLEGRPSWWFSDMGPILFLWLAFVLSVPLGIVVTSSVGPRPRGRIMKWCAGIALVLAVVAAGLLGFGGEPLENVLFYMTSIGAWSMTMPAWTQLAERRPVSRRHRVGILLAVAVIGSVALTDWPFRLISFPLAQPRLDRMVEEIRLGLRPVPDGPVEIGVADVLLC